MTSQTLAVMKLVATGNDFVFINGIDAIPSEWPTVDRAELARILCDRHFGIGADGLVIIERDPLATADIAAMEIPRLRWDFYNSDGSTAEMCGNATRCYGRWVERVLDQGQSTLSTVAGSVGVKAAADAIESTLEFVRTEGKQISFESNGSARSATLINTGVPHAVLEVLDLVAAQKELSVIQKLRFHSEVGPRGANVTLIQKLTSTHFKTVTFERGVENYTLSCGTGVLAAAIVGLGGGAGAESIATLETPGGKLSVRLLGPGKGVALSGPAEITFQTKIDLNSSLYPQIYSTVNSATNRMPNLATQSTTNLKINGVPK